MYIVFQYIIYFNIEFTPARNLLQYRIHFDIQMYFYTKFNSTSNLFPRHYRPAAAKYFYYRVKLHNFTLPKEKST